MKLSLYIANRIAFNERTSFSRFIIRIAILAVTLSVSVMIIGTAVTQGYQDVISTKFFNCWGHIHVTNFLPEAGSILNDEKILFDKNLENQIRKHKGVTSIHPYTVQSSLLKTKSDMEGLLLKGVFSAQNYAPLKDYLIAGRSFQTSDSSFNPILISKYTADKLQLNVNDAIVLYFLNKNQYQPKARKAIVIGIFNTGLEDYDKMFALCNASLIHQINDESDDKIQGYEIHIENPAQADIIEQEIYEQYLSPPLQAYTLQKRFPNVFSWLNMMQMNERIIIVIMLVIAIINMITALLILILERTQMIGILKSIGMRNGTIRQIFLINSLQVILLGILFGSVLGISICLLQQYAGIIKLDEATYYVKTVPISLKFKTIVWIDIVTIISCLTLLIIPSFIIKNITPVKALKFN